MRFITYFASCIAVANITYSQNLPIRENFTAGLNTNIWELYTTNGSDLTILNNKLYYKVDSATTNDTDAVLICKIPISLNKSWESEFTINTGSIPISNSEAFRKAGFVIFDATNRGKVLTLKAYDEGINATPYAAYSNNFMTNTIEGTNQLQKYQNNTVSPYPSTVKAKVSWCASTAVLKATIIDPYNGLPNFELSGIELGDPFGVVGQNQASGFICIGIIMKSYNQTCSMADSFYLTEVKIAEALDLAITTTSNLNSSSSWPTNVIITQPQYDARGFFRLTPVGY